MYLKTDRTSVSYCSEVCYQYVCSQGIRCSERLTKPLGRHVQCDLEHGKSSGKVLGASAQAGNPAFLLQVGVERAGSFVAEEMG